MLRVFVTNTMSLDREDSITTWTMRVEGKVLDPAGATAAAAPRAESARIKRKFSTFFSRILVDFERGGIEEDESTVEWQTSPTASEFDAFEITRTTRGPVQQATIFLTLDAQPPVYRLAAKLANIVDLHSATRASVLAALMTYAQQQRLISIETPDVIRCDAYLKDVRVAFLWYRMGRVLNLVAPCGRSAAIWLPFGHAWRAAGAGCPPAVPGRARVDSHPHVARSRCCVAHHC
jgi:hypothetical protein